MILCVKRVWGNAVECTKRTVSLQDYTVSLMLALSWYQSDLNYQYQVDFFEIDNENMKKIWIPDLYFPNEKKASFHRVMSPNQMMRLYPTGRLEYFARSAWDSNT